MYVVLDTECYENYFLATFTFENGEILEYEKINDKANIDLSAIGRRIMGPYTLITFNGWRYDLPLLSMAMAGFSNAALKQASDAIIQTELMPWQVERKYSFNILQIDHIDIINLLPLFESLKLYGARNATDKLQDLPFDPADLITAEKAVELRTYCRNDCAMTWGLFLKIWPQIELRYQLGIQYNLDLRSKSDAQIAEAVMKAEYQRITLSSLVKPIDAGNLPTQVSYTPPTWVKFSRASLNSFVYRLSREVFTLTESGSPISPEWLKSKTLAIDDRPYAVGLGGLHAQNKCESYFSSSRSGRLIDIDVKSYYPSIILNNGYHPPHMGAAFTQIYKKLVDQRLEAKASGDKIVADGLKITINGTFGKLGSRYSAVYAPDLLVAVTFTGQLALLMLIEMMAQRGIQCVSANTDGITILSKDEGLTRQVVDEWESVTNFEMEYTFYDSIHYRDVNNYFALTTDGAVKTKGIFREPALNKNPTTPIVSKAAMDYVLYAKPVWETIDECNDIHQFLAVRTVKGGAAKDGEYLGKAIRWYYSRDTDTAIHYISNGNKVAKTDGAMPMMNVSGMMPADLDADWYVDAAQTMVDEVGYFAWL